MYFICPIFYDFYIKGGEVIIKIDKEYSCVWIDEFNYLTQHGIRYTFVKNIDGVTIWKFKKDFELFSVLSQFYKNVYSK